MNTEKFHNRLNAAYFTFAAASFIALLGSLWWGGLSFLVATPLNTVLVVLGIVYIVAAVISLRHACCGPLSWVGCSCGGKSRGNVMRSIALFIPLPIFAYYMYGTMIKLTFDNSPRSFENVKTQLELDRFLFGHVRAEGITWHFAKKAFKHHYDDMANRIDDLLIKSMIDRSASRDEMAHLMGKLASYHIRNGSLAQAELELKASLEGCSCSNKQPYQQIVLSCIEEMRGHQDEADKDASAGRQGLIHMLQENSQVK